jgi:ABC-type proline/glycine betaine transport system substrate-binding protein
VSGKTKRYDYVKAVQLAFSEPGYYYPDGDESAIRKALRKLVREAIREWHGPEYMHESEIEAMRDIAKKLVP